MAKPTTSAKNQGSALQGSVPQEFSVDQAMLLISQLATMIELLRSLFGAAAGKRSLSMMPGPGTLQGQQDLSLPNLGSMKEILEFLRSINMEEIKEMMEKVKAMIAMLQELWAYISKFNTPQPEPQPEPTPAMDSRKPNKTP